MDVIQKVADGHLPLIRNSFDSEGSNLSLDKFELELYQKHKRLSQVDRFCIVTDFLSKMHVRRRGLTGVFRHRKGNWLNSAVTSRRGDFSIENWQKSHKKRQSETVHKKGERYYTDARSLLK
jgi:hypothetical protein